MGNALVRQLGVSGSSESLLASRKTGFFQFTDLDRTAMVRRINMRYESTLTITVKIFADGDIANPIFQDTIRPNTGTSSILVNEVATMDNSSTTLNTDSTTKFKNGDFIKIDDEIMKIITAGTTSHTVQRGMRNTTAAAHNDDAPIHYANHPNVALRVSRRAKYLMVEVSTESGTGSCIINRMELEYE
tara:strand:- start:2961 stop:3524 length:564 start_codon:yes stop_codon:yes gene_type:complete